MKPPPHPRTPRSHPFRRHATLAFFAAAILSLHVPLVQAQRLRITPSVGARFGGSVSTFVDTEQDSLEEPAATERRSSEVSLDDTASFSISVALEIDQSPITTFLELYYSRQSSEFGLDAKDFGVEESEAAELGARRFGKNSVDFKVEYIHIGYIAYTHRNKLRPFFTPSVGVTRFSSDDGNIESDYRFSLSFGAGFDYQFTDNFGWRVMARGYATITDEDSRIACDGDECVLQFDSSAMLQSEISTGLLLVF